MAAFKPTSAQLATKTGAVVKAPVAPKKAVAGVLAASLIACATPSLAFDAEQLADGKVVFNGNCAACHSGGGNTVITERTLKKPAIEQYLDGGYNVEAIKYQVINGKGAMPAWGDRLDDDDIDAVVAYVYDQATKW